MQVGWIRLELFRVGFGFKPGEGSGAFFFVVIENSKEALGQYFTVVKFEGKSIVITGSS